MERKPVTESRCDMVVKKENNLETIHLRLSGLLLINYVKLNMKFCCAASQFYNH